jgi:hypothetical protein
MEILKQLWTTQYDLEDVLRLESTPEDVKETKEGKRLLRWLRRRRRLIKFVEMILRRKVNG